MDYVGLFSFMYPAWHLLHAICLTTVALVDFSGKKLKTYFIALFNCPSPPLKDVPHGPMTSHSYNSPENYAVTEGVVQVGPYTGTVEFLP